MTEIKNALHVLWGQRGQISGGRRIKSWIGLDISYDFGIMSRVAVVIGMAP